MARRLCGFGLILLGACAGAGSEPAPQARALPFIAPPAGEAVITAIARRDQVALAGPRVDAEPGDFLLEHAGMVAVVSAREGDVVDYGPAGAKDELVAIAPTPFDGSQPLRYPVVFIGVDPLAPGVLHVVRRGGPLPIRLHTFVTFQDEILVIESVAEPDEHSADGMALGLGERVAWGNTPTFVEGRGLLRTEGGSYTTKFFAREGRELSYAVSFGDQPTYARFSSPYLSGYYIAGRASAFVTAERAGVGARRTLRVSTSPTSIGDAARKLWDPSGFRTWASPKSDVQGARVEVAECADKEKDKPRRPLARFAPGEPLWTPAEGCFEGRLAAPGHAATAWTPIADLAGLSLAEVGGLIVTVREGDKPIPARVQVRGVAGTPDPDWGDDPDDGSAVNAAQTRMGLVTRALPPGRYRVIVDRGFEYSAFEAPIEVRAGARTVVSAELERVVDTRGWLSADLHLHCAPSPDAPQPLEERVTSLAAAGVEVGVATDHNRVTDYAPVIARLGLTPWVASVVGDEITTETTAFGHFNAFPLEAGSEPLRYRATSPRGILAEARARPPLLAEGVIQINHPRMGDIGYFDVIRLDRDDVPGFVAHHPEAPFDFDAIEVFNGDDATSPATVEAILKDWGALIDAGHRLTATGNSDSHRLAFHEPGLPRNLVASKSDDPSAFDERAFTRAVREGRVSVSSGPFVTLRAGDAGIGDRVAPGKRKVVAEVQAPKWVDLTYLEIVSKGKPVARVEGPFGGTDKVWRATLEVELDLKAGDWVYAKAGGSKEMDVLLRRGAVPFAFTNPIFAGSP